MGASAQTLTLDSRSPYVLEADCDESSDVASITIGAEKITANREDGILNVGFVSESIKGGVDGLTPRG